MTHKRVLVVVITVWLLTAFMLLSLFVFLPDIYYLFLSSSAIVCLLLIAVVSYRFYVVLRRHRNKIQAKIQEGQVTQDCRNEMTNIAIVRRSAVLYILSLRCISYLVYTILYFCLVSFKATAQL